MKRQRMGAVLLTILLSSFALGYALAYVVQTQNIWHGSKKPAVHIADLEPRVTKDTPIIYKKEYTLSARVIVSDFTYKDDIIGKSLDQVRDKYSSANGFSIFWQDKTLLIHQKINDWSPEDKAKLRLKEYRSKVAVYRGPNSKNDALFRVTAIAFNTLPIQVQKAIQEGKYEFQDEQALNDALENMDEYI